MEQLESFALLILAGLLAYIFSCILKYFEKCCINYRLKKLEKNQLYKKRCELLHDDAFNYYYTLAVTRPDLLSYDLASKDINRLKRENLIFTMYSKLKKEY